MFLILRPIKQGRYAAQKPRQGSTASMHHVPGKKISGKPTKSPAIYPHPYPIPAQKNPTVSPAKPPGRFYRLVAAIPPDQSP